MPIDRGLAGNDASALVVVEAVQVFAFFFGDLLTLGHRNLADLVLVRLAAAPWEPWPLLQEFADGGLLSSMSNVRSL